MSFTQENLQLSAEAYVEQLEGIARALCFQAATQSREDETYQHMVNLAAQAANVLQAGNTQERVDASITRLEVIGVLVQAMENNRAWCGVFPQSADETDEQLEHDLNRVLDLLAATPEEREPESFSTIVERDRG